METPKGTRSQRFLLESGDATHIFSNADKITLQLRHEVPTEVDGRNLVQRIGGFDPS